jgi:CHAT domain-containing protein
MRFRLLICCVCFISLVYSANVNDSLKISEEYKRAYIDNKKNLPKRISEFQKLIIKANELGLSQNWIQDKLVYRLAQDYSRIGDFDRAIEINSSLTQHFDSIGDYENLVWCYADLATYYNNQSKHREVKLAYEKGLQIALENQISDRLIDLYDGLASVSIDLNELLSAKRYIALTDERLSFYLERDKKEVETYFNITKAKYYLALKDDEKSEKYYRDAIAIASSIEHRKVADLRADLAQLYLRSNRKEEAIAQLTKIIEHFGADTNSAFKDIYLIKAYEMQAMVYLKDNEIKNAQGAIRNARQQIDFFHNQYVFATSKLYLNKMRRKILELGMHIEYKAFQKTGNQKHLIQALLFADQAKSNVLNERMQLASIVNSNAISHDTRDLRFQRVYQLNQYETDGNTNEAIKLRNSIDSLDRALGLKKSKSFSAEGLQRIQRGMTDNQLLIEYFIVKSTLYTFSITKDNISATQKQFTATQEVLTYYEILQNPSVSIEDFWKSSIPLYELLIPMGIENYTDVTIIPDGVLYFLPFGTLINNSTAKPSWGSLPYLEKSHTLSYDFSLQTMTQASTYDYSSSYTGFAPRFDNNEELTYLTGGADVVKQGYDAFGGSTYLAADATSNNLRNLGINSKILQLYTHAVSSDSSYDASYIYLADKKMYVDEIMTLPLRTELCLLTACEVGLGKSYSGEGVTGVAWAFRAAGAQNVVQSLWRINQESSATVMNSFFESLADSDLSTKALQIAKLDYLKNEDVSERLKHPYYWAGMSHYGSGMTSQSGKWSIWQIILLCAAVSLGAFGVRSAIRKIKTV